MPCVLLRGVPRHQISESGTKDWKGSSLLEKFSANSVDYVTGKLYKEMGASHPGVGTRSIDALNM